MIDDHNHRAIQDAYSGTSPVNAANAQIAQKIREAVNTSFLARIDTCTTSGAAGSGTVNATPLVAQIDAEGTAQPSPSYAALPHSRLQAGIAAIVINPVPGDIGVFSCMKADSSGVAQGASAPGVPASYRTFDPAAAMMVGTVHTKAPTDYIELKQDNTIYVKCPAGYKLETGADVVINASGSVTITAPAVTINGNVAVNGSITASGDVSGSGNSLHSHTHPGDSGGTTGAPN